ncbi:MAG: NAD(P)H-dependent oxidoreductase [Candidatus Bipolaricaulota bacterium]
MTEAQRAVLLVGSPRGVERSASGRLGERLLDELRRRGFTGDTVHVHEALMAPADLDKTLRLVGEADVVLLSAPLYVDSFPAPVIALMEELVAKSCGKGRVAFLLLIQCGFPEREQNASAVALAERFAHEAGWRWLGALALGGAQVYRRVPESAFARIADAIGRGEPPPDVPLPKGMPPWLYRVGGNAMWRRMARKTGTAGRLDARPYDAESTS